MQEMGRREREALPNERGEEEEERERAKERRRKK